MSLLAASAAPYNKKLSVISHFTLSCIARFDPGQAKIQAVPVGYTFLVFPQNQLIKLLNLYNFPSPVHSCNVTVWTLIVPIKLICYLSVKVVHFVEA